MKEERHWSMFIAFSAEAVGFWLSSYIWAQNSTIFSAT